MVWHFRAENDEDRRKWMGEVSKIAAIQYDRLNVLGIGGQGMVYKLREKSTQKCYALKEMVIKDEKAVSN